MALTKTTYYVEGLCCSEEEAVIRKRLSSLPGINALKFQLISRKVTVEHSCPGEEVLNAIRGAGFTPRLHFDLDENTGFFHRHRKSISAVAGGVFFVAGVLSQIYDSSGIAAPLLFIAASVAGGWKIAYKGFKAVSGLSLEMNFLMVVAAIGAMAIGRWTEGAAIVLLFSFSQLLESYSMDRTRNALRSMMNLSPLTATVVRDGFEFLSNVEEINLGETVRIRPGERVPLDGVATEGESAVNQAPITGEPLPVPKRAGDEVFAGTVNERGTFDMKVTKRYYDTTLARIIETVEEAQSERAPMQQLVERFAHYYTPSILVLAMGIFVFPPLLAGAVWSVWFYRALVLLVIACPCALVISTPVSIVSALTNAARNGVLIKGGRYLEAMGAITAIAFDKTGTLTEGTPRVTDIIPLNSISADEILRITAIIEMRSEHHLAGAILRRAFESAVRFDNISHEHFESLTGRGVKAVLDGEIYYVGNHALIEERNICSPAVEKILTELEREGKTTTILCSEREPLGIIAVTDIVRKEGSDIVRALHREGIVNVAMLTGDNPDSAGVIARRLGIDTVHAGLMPENKVGIIRAMKERGGVAMIGDGINDAPALASATVGIAMGKTGTDIALETADVVLMSDDLGRVPYVVSLGKRATRIIRQNLFVAIGMKLVFLMLGIFGATSLWLAVLADDGATLIVIANGLRLLRSRKQT